MIESFNDFVSITAVIAILLAVLGLLYVNSDRYRTKKDKFNKDYYSEVYDIEEDEFDY